MKQEVNEKYDTLILKLDKSDPTYLSRKYSYDSQREKDLDSIKTKEEHKKRTGQKRDFHDIADKIDQVSKLRTTKMMVDFCAEETVTIKSFGVKKRQEVQVTTRFLSGKMLMFAKLFFMSFIYEVLETFCFPDEKAEKIYEKYLIEKVYMYHILTDTDSICLQFLFVSDPSSNIVDAKYREIIFEVINASEIYYRFDTSLEF